MSVASGATLSVSNVTLFGLTSQSFVTGSTLTLNDGVVYRHTSDGTTNFVMTDFSSTLEFIGATFERNDSSAQNPLFLTTGGLIVDHTSKIDAENQGIKLGSGSAVLQNLAVEIRPGATIRLVDGDLVYASVSSNPA